MGMFDRKDAIDALFDLLDRERIAVLDARFDALERLTAEKQRLLQGIPTRGVAPEVLLRLKQGFERNAGLILAMQNGVGAAIRKLEAARNGPAPLETYTSTGLRQLMRAANPSLQRRA